MVPSKLMTLTKPTISTRVEEEDLIAKEAAATTEPDWLNSMAVESFFNSDGDIDSMGLDVSDDS
jgi:hypothetical protein